MAAAADAGDAEVVNMRTTINQMSDSITNLQNQMALLMEDSDQFWARYQHMTPEAQSGERGPAVRERLYAHTSETDRVTMKEMETVSTTHKEKIDELESNISFNSSELTGDRDKFTQMAEATSVMRNDLSSSRASVNGVRGEKQVVTAIRGFDKLRTYKGAAVEWKEWRFKLVT